MGLDMYLRLRKAHDWHSNREWFTSYDNAWGCKWRLSESTYTVCEWRKANAIHKWFVDHVQDGEDDCGRYPVSVDKLKDCLLYTSPSPRDQRGSRMPSSA